MTRVTVARMSDVLLFIYLIWNRTRSTIKAKKKSKEKSMQTKLRAYTNKGMQIVTRAERNVKDFAYVKDFAF